MPEVGQELLARFREIDHLMGGTRQSLEFRRWQAATSDLLRKALGFHPVVVQFQGLRFRAGPVNVGFFAGEESAHISAETHDHRMRQDLAEAARLLRQALEHLSVDPDSAPAPDPLEVAVGAAAVSTEARSAALDAAARLRRVLATPAPAWDAVGPDLRTLLALDLPVARAVLSAVAARLADLR